MKKLLVSLIILLSPINSKAEIFKQPLANPRSTGDVSMTLNQTKYKGFYVGYLEGVISRNFTLCRTNIMGIDAELGAFAGAWVILGYDDGSFPLITEDFKFGLPLSVRRRNWSASLSFEHISSHQGDGMDLLLEKSLSGGELARFRMYEEMAEDEGIGISIKDPEGYSRDYISLYLSHDTHEDSYRYRKYVHLGYAHKIIPDDLKREFLGFGVEAKRNSKFNPYYSVDITWNRDTESIDYSGQAGIYLLKKYSEVRFAFTGFWGMDRKGQMLGRKDRRVGFGLFIK